MKVTAAGFNSHHDQSFRLDRPCGPKNYLMLAFKSNASLTVKGTEYQVTPKSVILFTPDCSHVIKAVDNDYVDDWTFFSVEDDGDLAMLRTLGIPLNTLLHHYDSFYFCDIMQHITSEFYSANERRDENMEAMLKLMLSKLSELVYAGRNTGDNSRYYNQLIELRHEISNHPEKPWTVDSMAKNLKISSPYFQRLYKATFGVSVIADVLDSRMKCAKSYLLNTDYKIYTIAEKCGYNNTTHFMRQFKKAVGLTPSEYRYCG